MYLYTDVDVFALIYTLKSEHYLTLFLVHFDLKTAGIGYMAAELQQDYNRITTQNYSNFPLYINTFLWFVIL